MVPLRGWLKLFTAARTPRQPRSGTMQCDDAIWEVIGNKKNMCAFRHTTRQPKHYFCRNEFNLTGLCSRATCPLANSNYGTVVEIEGDIWLMIKTVERAHSPANMWEKLKLSQNFGEALEQISEEMMHWPEPMVNKCKQRLTKIRQMLIRMRRLASRPQARLVATGRKVRKREDARELKAETAAKVDLAIEKELLARLKQGTYGDIYNFPLANFNKALDMEADESQNLEYVEGEVSEDEEEEEEEDEEEEEEDVDMEDLGFEPSSKRPRTGPRVEIEYEMEDDREMQAA
mmetsp:Transcript_26243/g.59803  ORF Transcript_26243/g.59803 Transcript_26243/m.59803 type:complete len:289 (-) Transcript_26243:94-960(-)